VLHYSQPAQHLQMMSWRRLGMMCYRHRRHYIELPVQATLWPFISAPIHYALRQTRRRVYMIYYGQKCCCVRTGRRLIHSALGAYRYYFKHFAFWTCREASADGKASVKTSLWGVLPFVRREIDIPTGCIIARSRGVSRFYVRGIWRDFYGSCII
jgi:hypothetical protein